MLEETWSKKRLLLFALNICYLLVALVSEAFFRVEESVELTCQSYQKIAVNVTFVQR